MKLPKSFTPEAAAWHAEIDAMGSALADASIEQGQTLSEDQRIALVHLSRFGSDSYPLRKVGKKWGLEHSCAQGFPLRNTKSEAIRDWEILLARHSVGRDLLRIEHEHGTGGSSGVASWTTPRTRP